MIVIQNKEKDIIGVGTTLPIALAMAGIHKNKSDYIRKLLSNSYDDIATWKGHIISKYRR